MKSFLFFFQNCDCFFNGNGSLTASAEHILERERTACHLVRADDGSVGEAGFARVFHFLLHALFAVINVAGNARFAEFRGNGNGVGDRILVHGNDEDLRHRARAGRDQSVIAELREESGQTDGDADARKLLIGIIAREVIVTAAGANAAEFGMGVDDGFVNGARVVVQTSRDGKVDAEAFLGHTEGDHRFGHGFQLVDAVLENLVLHAERAELFDGLPSVTADGDEGNDGLRFVLGNAGGDQLCDDLFLTDLFDLVDGTEDLLDLVGESEGGEEAAEHLAVIQTDGEITDAELFENVVNDGGHFRVVENTELIVADDVDVALIELAEASLLGAFAAENLAHLIALEREGQIVIVRRHVARERYGQVKAERKIVIALIETVDLLFGLAARLCEEDLGKLDDRRIQREKAEAFVDAADLIVHIVKKDLVGRKQFHEAGQNSGSHFFHRYCLSPSNIGFEMIIKHHYNTHFFIFQYFISDSYRFFA